MTMLVTHLASSNLVLLASGSGSFRTSPRAEVWQRMQETLSFVQDRSQDQITRVAALHDYYHQAISLPEHDRYCLDATNNLLDLAKHPPLREATAALDWPALFGTLPPKTNPRPLILRLRNLASSSWESSLQPALEPVPANTALSTYPQAALYEQGGIAYHDKNHENRLCYAEVLKALSAKKSIGARDAALVQGLTKLLNDPNSSVDIPILSKIGAKAEKFYDLNMSLGCAGGLLVGLVFGIPFLGSDIPLAGMLISIALWILMPRFIAFITIYVAEKYTDYSKHIKPLQQAWRKELAGFERFEVEKWEKALAATNKSASSSDSPTQRVRAPEESDSKEPASEPEVVKVPNETASKPRRKA